MFLRCTKQGRETIFELGKIIDHELYDVSGEIAGKEEDDYKNRTEMNVKRAMEINCVLPRLVTYFEIPNLYMATVKLPQFIKISYYEDKVKKYIILHTENVQVELLNENGNIMKEIYKNEK